MWCAFVCTDLLRIIGGIGSLLFLLANMFVGGELLQ